MLQCWICPPCNRLEIIKVRILITSVMVPKLSRRANNTVVHSSKNISPSYIVHICPSLYVVFGDFIYKELHVLTKFSFICSTRPTAFYICHISVRENPNFVVQIPWNSIDNLAHLTLNRRRNARKNSQLYLKPSTPGIVNTLQSIRYDCILFMNSDDSSIISKIPHALVWCSTG